MMWLFTISHMPPHNLLYRILHNQRHLLLDYQSHHHQGAGEGGQASPGRIIPSSLLSFLSAWLLRHPRRRFYTIIITLLLLISLAKGSDKVSFIISPRAAPTLSPPWGDFCTRTPRASSSGSKFSRPTLTLYWRTTSIAWGSRFCFLVTPARSAF